MITISKEDFEYYVPAAIAPDDMIFDKLKSFFENAENHLVANYIGNGMLENELISKPCKAYICLLAFYMAIPQLDIVITNNGFAVTNTQNLAPASKDRVERLMERCLFSANKWLDQLLQIIYMDDELLRIWNDNGMASKVIKSLLWNSKQLTTFFGAKNPTQEDVEKMMPTIFMLTPYITACVSMDYYNELLSKMRTRKLTEDDEPIVNLILHALAVGVMKPDKSSIPTLQELSRYLDKNVDKYATYAASPEYLARTHVYENDPTGTIFFSC